MCSAEKTTFDWCPENARSRWFGESIPTDSYGGVTDEANARELRSHTANAIEAGIKFLLEEREQEPGRSVVNRLFGKGSD